MDSIHWPEILKGYAPDPCKPAIWARGGQAQTLIGHLLPSPKPTAEPEFQELALPDGDRLILEHYPADRDVVIYLFHGLGGSTESDYMGRSVRHFHGLGYPIYAVNHRGCGPGKGLAKGPYHSGRGEDVSAVIAYGRQQYPDHRHLAIGFSLSGNALLLLLSGQRGEVQPDRAIAVNAPINLERSAIKIKTGFNKLYDKRFVRRCKLAVEGRSAAGLIPDYEFPAGTTLHDFDNIYTAPEGGFENREDYYRSCSTHQLLDRIKVPTVILTAADDPMVDVADYRAARTSTSVYLHIEETGGHMGYYHGSNTPLGSRRWLDYALDSFVKGLTEHP